MSHTLITLPYLCACCNILTVIYKPYWLWMASVILPHTYSTGLITKHFIWFHTEILWLANHGEFCELQIGISWLFLSIIQYWLCIFPYTVDYRYTVIIYDIMVYTVQQLRSGFNSLTTPHTPPLRRAIGCLSWAIQRKVTAIYRERTVYFSHKTHKCPTLECSISTSLPEAPLALMRLSTVITLCCWIIGDIPLSYSGYHIETYTKWSPFHK